MRRGVALWLLLLALYAATLALPGRDDGARTAREDRFLVATASVRDGHIETGPQPVGLGLPVLAAGVIAIGGVVLLRLVLAAALALAVVLGAALARRVVPEPWATSAALACGLSPPLLATATAVGPEPLAALLLAGAALCALRARDVPRLLPALAGGAQLAVLPWLDAHLTLPAAVLALTLVRWTRRRGRGLYGLIAGEFLVFSIIVFASVNERLYGAFVPKGPDTGSYTGAQGLADHAARAERLVAMWIDRSAGMLRWAPVLGLALYAIWLLWRSRRERMAVIVPEHIDTEVAAALCVLVCGAVVADVAFLRPQLVGAAFPGLHLVPVAALAIPLCAWGLRHAPRVGAVLILITLAASAWLVVAVATGSSGLAPPTSRAPLGPLDVLLPRFGTGSAGATAALVAVAAALVALVAHEARRGRGLR